MKQIERLPPFPSTSSLGLSPATRSSGADEFRRAIDLTQRVAAPAPSLACSAVNPMLLHEIRASEARRRDREARQRGRELLHALAALQRATLGMADPEAIRAQIGRLLDSVPEADDPALASVLRQIEIRASVEAARGRPGSRSPTA